MSNQKICGVYHMWFGNREALYIGSSIDVHLRFGQHRSELSAGGGSKANQAQFKLHGIGPCYVRIICPREELRAMEQEELDWWRTHHPDLVTNTDRTAVRDAWTDNEESADEDVRRAAAELRRIQEDKRVRSATYISMMNDAQRRSQAMGTPSEVRRVWQEEWAKIEALNAIITDKHRRAWAAARAQLDAAIASREATRKRIEQDGVVPENESFEDFLRRVL